MSGNNEGVLITQEHMDELRNNIGKRIRVYGSGSWGQSHNYTAELTSVVDFRILITGVSFGGSVYHFVSEYGGIQKVVRVEDGAVIYHNPAIPDDWAMVKVSDEERNDMMRASYGEERANRMITSDAEAMEKVLRAREKEKARDRTKQEVKHD